MQNILKHIRYKELAFIALAQILTKYCLLEPFTKSYGLFTRLNALGFGLLVFSTLCIATAGFLIYDLYSDNSIEDEDEDEDEDDDKLTLDDYLFNGFVIFTVIGVGLGFYISYSIGYSRLFTVFIICSALLYVYASFLKLYPIIGNISVSLVLGLAILLVGIFDLLPVMTMDNQRTQTTFLKLVLDYSVLIAMLNFLKSSIRDFLTINIDYKDGTNSLPIAIGKKRAKYLVLGINILIIAIIIFYLSAYLYKQQTIVLYVLLLILAPLILSTIKLFNAKNDKDFKQINTILAFTMLASICSLILHPIILLD